MLAGGAEAVLLKGSATAGTKATTWAGARITNERRDRRTREAAGHLSDMCADFDRVARRLNDEEAAEFAAFVASPEVEHTLLGIATECALRVCGKKSDRRLAQVYEEFSHNFRLATPSLSDAQRMGLTTPLFELMQQHATWAVNDRVDVDGALHPKARARLLKIAAGVAAASTRNIEALQAIDSAARIQAFEREYRAAVQNLHASMRLPHAGTTRQVPYDRLFVAPGVRHLTEDDQKAPVGHDEETLTLNDLISSSQRTLLLGNPGGGKSTSSLKLVHDVAVGRIPGLACTTPFLVVLRDYADQYSSNRLSVMDYLESLCEVPYAVEPDIGAIDNLLLNGRGFVVFDGLDELLDTSLRREIVAAVEGFAYRYPLTPVLVTSRLVGYEEAPLDPELFTAVALRDFNRDQVEAYTRKWFSLDDSTPIERRQRIVTSFLEDSKFVGDLRVNPLMLSLMCGIYSSENYIPRNRPDVYEKCALLLFERWDKQRGIEAPLAFDAHVQAAMRSLALWLYPRQEAQTGLPRAELISHMKDYLLQKRFDDELEAEEAASQFIDFCKGRAWVLTDMGSELYGFTHRTFLEYFAANQLVRTHTSATELFDVVEERIARSEWSVVTQLAVQILGKNVEDGADDFLDLLIDHAANQSSVRFRSNCTAFAVRTLQFIVPRPNVLRKILTSAVELSFMTNNESSEEPFDSEANSLALSAIFNCASENIPMVQKILRENLRERLAANALDEAALGFALYPGGYVQIGNRLVRGTAHEEVFQSWSADNWKVFDTAILEASFVFPWLAQERCRRGTLRISQVVSALGVRSLFEYRIAGRVVGPPIAYQVTSAWQMGDRPPLGRELLSDLVNTLVETPPPWFGDHADYDRLSMTGQTRSEPSASITEFVAARIAQTSTDMPSAALLCAMPIFERNNRGPMTSASRREFLRRFTGLSDDSHRKPVDVLSDLRLDPRVLRLASAWLVGDIKLVGRPVGKRRP